MSTLANAALWTRPVNREYTSSTPIYLQFKVNGELLTWQDQSFKLYSHPFAVAAFIDGECRSLTESADEGDRYSLRVWGDPSKDLGKTITIKMLYGGLVFSFNKTYTFDGESHGIDVLEVDYPTGLEIDHADINSTLPTKYDMADKIHLIYERTDGTRNENPSNEATIEDLNFSWYLGNYNLEFDAEDNNTVLTVKEDTWEGNYQISLTYLGVDDRENYGPRFVLSAWADINVTIPRIPVTSITYTGSPVFGGVGDDIYSKIVPFLVIAPDDATDKSFSINPDRAATAAGAFDNLGRALKEGQWNIEIRANDGFGAICVVSVTIKDILPSSFLFPSSLKLSKYRDTECKLTASQDDVLDPSKIAVFIVDEQGTPFPAATATMQSQDGLTWTFRGKYVSHGNYKFYFTYDGTPMTNERGESLSDIICPPELKLPENGWDWIMVPGKVNLFSEGSYDTGLLNYDANNKVLDVRSQDYLLYNDPVQGLFGDLKTFTPAEGMYKVKAKFDDKSVVDLSQYGISEWDASAISLAKKVSKGYTWVAYPNEFDCTVEDWNTNDDIEISQEGDMLIGKTGFAEYNGTAWVGSDGFKLEAGKGYIYYTESPDAFIPTLGTTDEVQTPAPSPARTRGTGRTKMRVPEWTYDHSQFADNMAIIAQVEGLSETQEDLCVGAFVGDECRGVGYLNATGKFFISVAGKANEEITLRVSNPSTGEISDINETLSFSMRQGSQKAPVKLTAKSDITSLQSGAKDAFDLYGRKVSSMNARGMYIVNGKKVIVK